MWIALCLAIAYTCKNIADRDWPYAWAGVVGLGLISTSLYFGYISERHDQEEM